MGVWVRSGVERCQVRLWGLFVTFVTALFRLCYRAGFGVAGWPR